ncbi:Pvc16 family protein [Pedobacter aquatilis]|uniref:Pvc16 family protein n=1 Tax=Pedobacter aquatilis TaxID=351343 RepID=UPI002930FEC5|nr:Pvc16 family protein [Pedobacter aquatilis]
MINTSLDFITKEINAHLNQIAGSDQRDFIIATSITSDGKLAIPRGKLGLSLINIEEEKLLRNKNVTAHNVADSIEYLNLPLYLNLYVLIAANFNTAESNSNNANYLEGLKRLSDVISFFQHKNVFTKSNSPLLFKTDPGIDRISAVLVNFNFEQMSQFWSISGHSYLPAIVYKLGIQAIQ